MTGAFRSSLFRCVVISAVHCRTVLLLLCFLVVGIHAAGICIPLSLLQYDRKTLSSRLNKMAWFTGFPVNAVKSTSARLEDLCKIE